MVKKYLTKLNRIVASFIAVIMCLTTFMSIPAIADTGITVFNYNTIRVRMVEYTPGYLADHWCKRGHVILVLEGELVTELDDGRKFVLTSSGTSYQVAEDANPHRSYTEGGAKLFIVD